MFISSGKNSFRSRQCLFLLCGHTIEYIILSFHLKILSVTAARSVSLKSLWAVGGQVLCFIHVCITSADRESKQLSTHVLTVTAHERICLEHWGEEHFDAKSWLGREECCD